MEDPHRSFTEIDIAITEGDLEAFEAAVEDAKSSAIAFAHAFPVSYPTVPALRSLRALPRRASRARHRPRTPFPPGPPR